jgi:hypothetical protein
VARLFFRQPVLADTWEEPAPPEGEAANDSPARLDGLRAVDRFGILLPSKAKTKNLPILDAGEEGPKAPAGKPWGNPRVTGAAILAGLIGPHQDCLQIRRIDSNANDLTLWTRGGSRVGWGSPPGKEAATEASTALKLNRLLSDCRLHGGLDLPEGPYNYNLRSRQRVPRQRLSPDR